MNIPEIAQKNKVTNRIKSYIKNNKRSFILCAIAFALCLILLSLSLVSCSDNHNKLTFTLAYYFMDAENEITNIYFDMDYTKIECVCTDGSLRDWNIGESKMTYNNNKITYTTGEHIRYAACGVNDANIYFKVYNDKKIIQSGTINIKTKLKATGEDYLKYKAKISLRDNNNLDIYREGKEKRQEWESDSFIISDIKKKKSFLDGFFNNYYIDNFNCDGIILDTIKYDIDNGGAKETITINECISEDDFIFRIIAKDKNNETEYSCYGIVCDEENSNDEISVWCNLNFEINKNKLQIRAIPIEKADRKKFFKYKLYDVVFNEMYKSIELKYVEHKK